MPHKDAKRPWEATRRGLANQLAEIDGILPGSVVVRRMRCGKGGCTEHLLRIIMKRITMSTCVAGDGR